MKLGFGKYAHTDLRDVPVEYLEWLRDNSAKAVRMIDHELTRREAAEEANLDWIDKIIKAGFRDLAKKHHPDGGGSDDEMKQLNAAYEALKEARR